MTPHCPRSLQLPAAHTLVFRSSASGCITGRPFFEGPFATNFKKERDNLHNTVLYILRVHVSGFVCFCVESITPHLGVSLDDGCQIGVIAYALNGLTNHFLRMSLHFTTRWKGTQILDAPLRQLETLQQRP